MWFFLVLAGAELVDSPHPNAASLDLTNTWTEVSLERSNHSVLYQPREERSLGVTFEILGLAASVARDLPALNDDGDGSQTENFNLGKTWERVAVDVGAAHFVGVRAAADGAYAYKRNMQVESAAATISGLIWSDGFQLSDAYSLRPGRKKGNGVFMALTLDYLTLRDRNGLIDDSLQATFAGALVGPEADVSAIRARAASAVIGTGGTTKFWKDRMFASIAAGYGLGRQVVTDVTPEGEHVATARFAHKRFERMALGVCAKQAFAGFLLASDEPNFDLNGTAVRSSRHSMSFSIGTTF